MFDCQMSEIELSTRTETFATMLEVETLDRQAMNNWRKLFLYMLYLTSEITQIDNLTANYD